MLNFKNHLLIGGCLFLLSYQAKATFTGDVAPMNKSLPQSRQYLVPSFEEEETEIDLSHLYPQFPQVDITTLKSTLKKIDQKVISLDVSGNFMHDEALGVISKYPHFQNLYLQDNFFTDKGAEFLQVFKMARQVNLSGNSITSKGIKFLPLDALEMLEVDFLKLGQEGLIYLSKAPNLYRLAISGAGLDDKAVNYLLGMSKLRYLTISYNNFSLIGIDRLKQGLPNTTIIAESSSQ